MSKNKHKLQHETIQWKSCSTAVKIYCVTDAQLTNKLRTLNFLMFFFTELPWVTHSKNTIRGKLKTLYFFWKFHWCFYPWYSVQNGSNSYRLYKPFYLLEIDWLLYSQNIRDCMPPFFCINIGKSLNVLRSLLLVEISFYLRSSPNFVWNVILFNDNNFPAISLKSPF